ncbi:Cytoplasmic trna 2-thiolation protein [Thalictrum thalictroides]|uniref:Cytoplasmic trna 2-thiolation protein n=1 Tax=Thalictrum thalictroides TaxID=46969 RepID=A0A7J6URL3_THATH|nr:Cytoplasmic trna 2-thiolation protein [Thalictrum thalictroides]
MTAGGCQNSSYKLNELQSKSNGNHGGNGRFVSFEMPLHYPRYKKEDYETMPEWQLDCLLKQYGLPVMGDVADKRNFAMGAFLWPSEINK